MFRSYIEEIERVKVSLMFLTGLFKGTGSNKGGDAQSVPMCLK